ncbi:MAG TPA: class E sortase [Acidimicrobiales bacterium]|nr:class E sortase [Acidimicrobiales bacterium]
MIRRALNISGRVLLALGVLILLFAAYQLWGTGLAESHSQATLRSTLDKELPAGATARADRIAGRGTSGSSGTVRPGPARVAATTATPPAGQPIGIIQIPRIGMDQVLVQGVSTANLQAGPGHYPGTPLPGQMGNASVAGHRTTYGHPFFDLDQVGPGDKIVVTTAQGIFVYTTTSQAVVSPADVAVIQATATPQLTLTTCNPRYSASQRLVVKARLTGSTLFGPAGRPGATTTTTAPARRELAGTGTATGLAGDGATGNAGRWVEAALLAVATVAVAVAVWLAGRRVRHRWAVYLPGAVAVLVVLFFFFTVVSPLLPATY